MMRHDSGTYPFCCADQPGEARDLCKDYPSTDIPRDSVFRYDSFE